MSDDFTFHYMMVCFSNEFDQTSIVGSSAYFCMQHSIHAKHPTRLVKLYFCFDPMNNKLLFNLDHDPMNNKIILKISHTGWSWK